MIRKTKQMVRVLAKGGILTPSYLLNILNVAKAAGNKHVYFGSRQDLLFAIDYNQMITLKSSLDALQTSYVIHSRKGVHFQNIVSSYVSSDLMAATPWLFSGNYLYILEMFNYQPTLRVNITDPRQSLVPLFYGHLNFVASTVKDYWYLYIKQDEKSTPERWPVLVLNSDIGTLSKKIEEHWETLKVSSLGDFFEFFHEQMDYNWRRIETDLLLEFIPPSDYEGFGKMYNAQNYWAGFYWRNNRYDIPFLEEVCHLCLRTNISKICLTPWKSFLVKEIREKDLLHWQRLLGRFGINMRHSSFELNWHLPLNDSAAFRLKRFIVSKFDKVDVCVHGLTFGIRTKPEPAFTSILIERVSAFKFLKSFDPFVSFRIWYAKDFNGNKGEYEEYMSQIPRYRLPQTLQELTLKYYAQLQKTSGIPDKKQKVAKTDEYLVYQCQHCFSIYDERNGDLMNGIKAGTAFENLHISYSCFLCGAPKADFKKIFLSHLTNKANV